MSAPVRESDDNGSLNDGASHYAPKSAQQTEHDQNPESAAPRVNTAPRPDTLEAPWKRKKLRGLFAGDDAVVELRTRSALAPDRMAEPPLPDSAGRAFGGAGRLIGVIAVVAISAVGYLLGQARRTPLPPEQFSPLSDRADLAPEPSAAAANLKVSSPDSTPAAVRPATGSLASGAASDVTRGLPNSATPVTAAPTASATQFNEQDRAPAPAQVVPRQPEVNAAGIAFMMKNGAELMERGDIAGARLMFKRPADAGDAGAAFALAETYDPLVLRKLGTRIAMMSDVALAQSWYKKARDLGSTLALERIARLTQLPDK